MREILFKGFYKNELGKERIQLDGKVIRGQWVKGQYIDGYICGKLAVADDENFMPEYWWKVRKETVGQYTGLQDKNGKNIFEGDKTKFLHLNETLIGFVEYIDDRFILAVGSWAGDLRRYSKTRNLFIEIIGNIFEVAE